MLIKHALIRSHHADSVQCAIELFGQEVDAVQVTNLNSFKILT